MAIIDRLEALREKNLAENRPEDAKLIGVSIEAIDRLSEALTVKSPEVMDIHGKRVMLLTPIYRGINGRTFFTLFRCFGQYGVEKVGLIPEFQTVIHEARNMLAKKFLETDAEWAIPVDDDMVLPSGSSHVTNRFFGARLPEPLSSYNAISRIMSHPDDKKLIGACYYVKQNPATGGHPNCGKAVCDLAFSDQSMNDRLHNPTPESGLIECNWVGLGFSRIHRSVFEDIIKASEGRWPDLQPSHPGGHYGIFQPIGPDVNEDLSFCRRYKALGGKIYIDSGLVCGHCEGVTTWWHWNTK